MGEGKGQGDHSSLQLFLESYFARDVFLEIRFCFNLQGIHNAFGPGPPRISLGALAPQSLQFNKIKYLHEKCLPLRSLVVSDLYSETKGSWLESDC